MSNHKERRDPIKSEMAIDGSNLSASDVSV